MKTNFPSTFRRALAAGFAAFALAHASVQADFDKALSFDGVNQYVAVPHFGTILPTQEVTVEFWALADEVRQQAAFMLLPDDALNRFNSHISYGNGNTYWDFGNIDAGGRLQVPNPADTVGVWTHYAFVASQSGQVMRMYVNGVLYTSTPSMEPFNAVDSELHIGGNLNFYFKGQIDEFRVWNTARTGAEIAAHYAGTLAGNEPGLVVYYRFDEAGGATAVNSATLTGPAFNGALVNNPVRSGSTVPVPEIAIVEAGGAPLKHGSVLAWGGNESGQTNVPPGLFDVDAVAAGLSHSVALRKDGSVLAWGDTTFGQANVPIGLTSGVTSISAGTYHSLALKADGTVVAWGRNQLGQLNVPAGLTDVVAISAGRAHSAALKRDGSVVAWGDNFNGQSNVPAGLTGIAAIAAGSNYTLALKNDGTIVSWGASIAQPPIPLTGVVAIAAGDAALAILSNGDVAAWGGSNTWGEAQVPPGLSGAVAIAAHGNQSVALDSEGRVFVWGRAQIQRNVPTGLRGCVAVATGGVHILAVAGLTSVFDPQPTGTSSAPKTFTIKNTGGAPLHISSVSVTGSDPEDFTVDTTGMLASVPAITGETSFTVTFRPGAAGPRQTTLRVRSDDGDEGDLNIALLGPVAVPRIVVEQPGGTPVGTGTLVSWGFDDGFHNQTVLPNPPLMGVARLGPGRYHSLAILQNGLFRGWGGDNVYQENSINGAFGLSDLVGISGGDSFSVALKSDGTLVAWGFNESGETNFPVEARDLASIGVGRYHSVAVRRDGTVIGWGDAGGGGLSMVSELTNVAAVRAGAGFTMALQNDGHVIAFGSNNRGQTNVPPGLSGVVAISAYGSHSLALKSDGTVVAWGDNTVGQSTVPAGLTGVTAISGGQDFSAALKSDGSVVIWGRNYGGLLDVPAGLAGVATLAAGAEFCVAVTSPTMAFSDQPVGTASGAKTFTIRNTGNAPLHLTGVRLTGGDLGDFVLTAPAMPASIAPASTATFTVTFTPGASGLRRAMLRVQSDDLVENNIGLFFTGTGTGTLTPLQSWRLQRFGTATGLGLAADTADPNANGIANLSEYALGGDPTGNTTGVGIVPQSSFNGTGKLQLAFIRYLDRSDITLTAQASDALAGPWADLAKSVNGAAFTILTSGVTMSETGADNARSIIIGDLYPKTDPAHPRRFLRLKVTTP